MTRLLLVLPAVRQAEGCRRDALRYRNATGTAVFVTGRAAERDERLHRSAASIGVLTGATNRRAFFDGAESMLCDGAELSRIVFGLDRFKAINDTPPVLMDRHVQCAPVIGIHHFRLALT